MFLFFLAFRDEHERQFMRERGMAVCRNHKKSFLGPGSNLAALGLITGLQPGCQQESCVISSSAKWAIYHVTGERGSISEIHCWAGQQIGNGCLIRISSVWI